MHIMPIETVDLMNFYNIKKASLLQRGISESKRNSILSTNNDGTFSLLQTNTQLLNSNKIENLNFRQFMLKLCGPHEQIQGCPINFTDTAFFDDQGRITEVVRTDKDGFISCTRQEQKLILQDIRRTFSYIVRERRKELSFEQIKLQQQRQADLKDNNREGSSSNMFLEKQLSVISKNKTEQGNNNDNTVNNQQFQSIQKSRTSKEPYNQSAIFEDENGDENQQHYKDAAILRDNDGCVKVENESEFISEFRRRANDPFWKSLECIQTCVKSKVGLGKHIFIPFKVEVKNKEHINQEIEYQFDLIGKREEQKVIDDAQFHGIIQTNFEIQKEVEEILRRIDPHSYCQRQALKIGYYIQQIYQMEVIQMDLDFFQDDNGKIWLFYAKNVTVRHMKKTALQLLKEQQQQLIQQNKSQQKSMVNKNQFFKEDSFFTGQTSQQQNRKRKMSSFVQNMFQKKDQYSIDQLEKVMAQYFDNMKDSLRIMKEFESSGTDEESSSAMKALRPNVKNFENSSQKFKEVVAQESARRKKMMYSNKNFYSITKDFNKMNKTFITQDQSTKKDKIIIPQNELIRRYNNKSINQTTIENKETYESTIQNVSEYNKTQMNYAKSLYLDKLENKSNASSKMKKLDSSFFNNNVQEFIIKRKNYEQTQINQYKDKLKEKLRDAYARRDMVNTAMTNYLDTSQLLQANENSRNNSQFKAYTSQTGRKFNKSSILASNQKLYRQTQQYWNRSSSKYEMKQTIDYNSVNKISSMRSEYQSTPIMNQVNKTAYY
ncbi:UNKNOWN [Stylonychia lemnae]|uniref:Uncharacterized protein n=1 Tax=Stylonychia lemnae TaxID=5949 RepID=A0A078A1P7_STYLE|nr:UNKNOWN [Stylonychia lemnae]|eukprot:CDW75762.1 UNKNOWN [Stylonychia lemnae]